MFLQGIPLGIQYFFRYTVSGLTQLAQIAGGATPRHATI